MAGKMGGLEDDFPFQLGDFLVPAVNFPGCINHHCCDGCFLDAPH